jgi:predicted nucleotidyltransferase
VTVSASASAASIDAPVASLRPHECAAALEVVRRVRARVRAELVQAVIFGSKARGEGRPDSDVDLLLIFRALPPDREPHATHAEALAAQVARETGVPVEVWCVSRPDLERGRRPPMLVDSLADAAPLWPEGAAVPQPRFTPDDACFCAGALLERVAEGGREVKARVDAGDPQWVPRLRDDVARLCTALLLLAGETRPRHAGAIRRMLDRERPYLALSPDERRLLAWVARSYGNGHAADEAPVPAPPVPLAVSARLVDRLCALVRRRLDRLACSGRAAFVNR